MEMPHTLRRIGANLSLALILASPVADAGIGRTPGIASVSPDGEAQYTIPIALPPGTNGMTPVLSLEYRHRTKGGLLGVGWSIGGLSQITRCARTVAQDGVAAPPLRTTDDRFCLDGQRLVIVNHVIYATPDAEYRTEIESFARIRAIPGSTNGPGLFHGRGCGRPHLRVRRHDGFAHRRNAGPVDERRARLGPQSHPGSRRQRHRFPLYRGIGQQCIPHREHPVQRQPDGRRRSIAPSLFPLRESSQQRSRLRLRLATCPCARSCGSIASM